MTAMLLLSYAEGDLERKQILQRLSMKEISLTEVKIIQLTPQSSSLYIDHLQRM